jgi:hypothetical protein
MFKVRLRLMQNNEFVILRAVLKGQEIAGHTQKWKNTSTLDVGGIASTESYVYAGKGVKLLA